MRGVVKRRARRRRGRCQADPAAAEQGDPTVVKTFARYGVTPLERAAVAALPTLTASRSFPPH